MGPGPPRRGCAGRSSGGHGAGDRLRLVAFEPRRIDWWSSVVQFAGTLLFNVDTFHALTTGFESDAYDRLVWSPDAVGSACFLVSGWLALVEPWVSARFTSSWSFDGG